MTQDLDPSVTDAPQSGDVDATAKTTPDPSSAQSAAEETFDTSQTFADLGLPKDVLEGITKSGFEHPTKIQAERLFFLLEGIPTPFIFSLWATTFLTLQMCRKACCVASHTPARERART